MKASSSNFTTKANSNESKWKKKKVDRLSRLPDEIIHRVLSFVDAVSAVQTSVLSKRWKKLWTSLPVLNFNSSSFHHPLLFHSFIHHFMSHRDSSTNLYALNFSCNDELDDGHMVDSIIDHLTLSPTIQLLTISAECPVANLPQLSLCQSLTTLKLADISTEATTFDFVSLQRFYLFDCWFECGAEKTLDLFRGCVNLR
ncbi:putative F-box/FBD/LRR-repeat protein At1g78840 [Cajanus cajan]|nr:putative F-box/FBD/LRR-repeat protein At1g78840 [Cajanus cajan]